MIPEHPVRRARNKATSMLGPTPGGRQLLRLAGVQTSFVLGDSHTRSFSHVERTGLLRRTHFEVTWVNGATSRGLANPNSKTNALERYRTALEGIPREDVVFVWLGEVDCGFIIWYMTSHHGTELDKEFDRSISSHLSFLDEVQEGGHRNLVVVEVPLPSIEDYASWRGLNNARADVDATLEQRTDLTRRYNAELHAYATRHSLPVLAYVEDTAEPGTGYLDPRFRNPNPLEHHPHPDRFAAVLAPRLRELGYR